MLKDGQVQYYYITIEPFPVYDRSTADNFENIREKDWKLPLNESTIIE